MMLCKNLIKLIELYSKNIVLSHIVFTIFLLQDHQLDFIKYSDHWRGSSATIVPIKNHHVWGAVWRVHNKDLKSLDW